MIVLAVIMAGGLGAVCRFVIDTWLSQWLLARSRADTASVQLPWATGLINLVGSFVLGVVVGVSRAPGVWSGLLPVVAVGWCGGFTTMSTAAVEVVRLVAARRWWQGLVWLAATTIASVAAITAGLWLVAPVS